MSDKPVAVVTGGANGIGAACARRFAAGGFHVVVADIDEAAGKATADSLSATGADAAFLRLDVSREDSVLECVADIRARFGVPAALVNSAGLLQGAVRITEMKLADYDAIHSVNLRGAMLTGRAIGVQMMARGRGSIVNLCSISSTRPSAQPAYATSKAGLKMLTEVMAAEFGAGGVRVNAVAPGYTMTPLMRKLVAEGKRDPALMIERSALGRFVEPEDVAEGIWFLCSEAARAITGIMLPIDCGWLVRSSYLSYATTPQ